MSLYTFMEKSDLFFESDAYADFSSRVFFVLGLIALLLIARMILKRLFPKGWNKDWDKPSW